MADSQCKRYPCGLCDKTFANPTNARRHRVIKHGNDIKGKGPSALTPAQEHRLQNTIDKVVQKVRQCPESVRVQAKHPPAHGKKNISQAVPVPYPHPRWEGETMPTSKMESQRASFIAACRVS